MGKFRKKVIILIYGIAITGLIFTPFIKQKNIKRSFSKQNTIAMYIEDNNGNYQLSSSKEFPKEGYILNLEKSNCKNGGILSQDVNTKEINLIISKNDACNLYFEKEKLPLLETIMNKRNDDTVTVYTEGMTGEMYTFDHEETTQTMGWSEIERRDYRYIGSAPNNWVKFNGEDWRIIGVFTVENSSETKEQLIKIIRNESIGYIPWDMRTAMAVYGKNEWANSSLKTLLNGNYINKKESFDYTFRNSSNANQTVTIPKGLSAEARGQIEEV